MGAGNIRLHSRTERRYYCKECQTTFAATTGTVFYRKQHAHALITLVLTLLAHGCPLQAIVRAFLLDDDTVRVWVLAAGQHCAVVHAHLVEAGQVATAHVQADELWVKLVGRRVWQAMAIAADSRLWLGGVISATRDLELIMRLVARVRSGVTSLDVLVCVDGLASYVTAFLRVFRQKVPRAGRRGCCRQEVARGFQLGQVIKRHRGRCLVEVIRRVVRGTADGIRAVVRDTATGTDIHTAYIERRNATFRNCWAGLTRKSRRIAKTIEVADAGMWLVGTPYNFCTPHDSLRVPVAGEGTRRWSERSPAMAAGLTTHMWTMTELFTFRVPLPAWKPPKHRDRKPKAKSPEQSSGKRKGKT